MTEQEIKDNAPCGATHYRSNSTGLRYFLIEDSKIFIFASWMDWVRYNLPIDSNSLKPL